MYQTTTGGCGRVVKTKLKDGSISFGFSISRNLRILGKATHITLSPIMTIREAELAAQANTFWKIADEKIAELTASGKLWQNDKSKIMNTFEKYIPRPTPVIIKATTPASDHELLRNMIKEVAAKAEKRLNAETV